MADREAQQKLYAYSEMSNKVQQANRSQRRSRGEGTGEVESLRGRSDAGRMGDRVSTIQKADSASSKRPAELEAMMERAKKKRQKRDQQTSSGGATNKRENILLSSGGQSILDLGELNGYQPTHAGSRASYESLLVSCLVACCHIMHACLSLFYFCTQKVLFIDQSSRSTRRPAFLIFYYQTLQFH